MIVLDASAPVVDDDVLPAGADEHVLAHLGNLHPPFRRTPSGAVRGELTTPHELANFSTARVVRHREGPLRELRP